MPSKPGRAPVSTSFKKGNTNALGNDKTQRFNTWLEKELNNELGEQNATVLGYAQEMIRKQALAKKLVDKALKEKDSALFKTLFSEIADRTEGRPQQSVDVTSQGKQIGSMSKEEASVRLDELD